MILAARLPKRRHTPQGGPATTSGMPVPPPPRIPSQAAPRDPDNFPFVVLGNKVDKEAERRVPKASAQQWTKSQGPTPLKYFETSAKDARQVDAAFLETATLALAADNAEADFIPDTINLAPPSAPKRRSGGSSCC